MDHAGIGVVQDAVQAPRLTEHRGPRASGRLPLVHVRAGGAHSLSQVAVGGTRDVDTPPHLDLVADERLDHVRDPGDGGLRDMDHRGRSTHGGRSLQR